MRLIVGWWRDRAPSGATALPLSIAPLMAHFLGAIVDVKEAF